MWVKMGASFFGGLLAFMIIPAAFTGRPSKPLATVQQPLATQTVAIDSVAPAQENVLTDDDRRLMQLGRKVASASGGPALAGTGKSFNVFVTCSPDALEVLSEAEARTRVELRMRQFGFSVSQQSANHLFVDISGVWQNRSHKTTMGTHVNLDVNQSCLRKKTNGDYSNVYATIWHNSYTGVAGNLVACNHINGGIDNVVDSFINACLAANP